MRLSPGTDIIRKAERGRNTWASLCHRLPIHRDDPLTRICQMRGPPAPRGGGPLVAFRARGEGEARGWARAHLVKGSGRGRQEI